MKEWQTFVRRFSDMREGRRELFVKDLTPGKRKYDARHVRATVSRSKTGLDNPDLLWIRGESGERMKDPWYMIIHEELEEWVPGRPWEDLLQAIEKRERDGG